MHFKLYLFPLITILIFACNPAYLRASIKSQVNNGWEIVGFNGLAEFSIGKLFNHDILDIKTPYRGLAILTFEQGQQYPIIISDQPLQLSFSSHQRSLKFKDGSENDLFYRTLTGEIPFQELNIDSIAYLMIQTIQLLESTYQITTAEELENKKREFHVFISRHYDRLKHSEMVRRLIAQYFIMHEYIDYHRDGAPATDIRIQYQKAVLEGIGNWIRLLQNHIPDHEVLNYCVSLYYDRSMVTLASLVIKNYSNAAYCPGAEKHTFTFPEDLRVIEADRDREWKLENFTPKKIIAFVSDDCPVSMVETVVEARRLAAQNNDVKLIVAPLQQLSDKHLTMSKMVSGGNLLFVDDKEWRKDNLATKVKLPLFVEIDAK